MPDGARIHLLLNAPHQLGQSFEHGRHYALLLLKPNELLGADVSPLGLPDSLHLQPHRSNLLPRSRLRRRLKLLQSFL